MYTLIDNPIAIQLLVFIVVVTSLVAIGSLAVNRERLIETRIRRLGTRMDVSGERTTGTMVSLKAKIPQVTESLLLSDGKQRMRLQKRFLEAGIYQPWVLPLFVATKCALTIGLPITCVAVVYSQELPFQYALLSGGSAAIVGLLMPHIWLQRRRANRHLILRRALPDFLDLLVACLGGGLSVQASLRQVADELQIAHSQLSAELRIVLREIELGGTLDHALQQLAGRTGLEEFRTLRSFIHQTTKFGTTIIDALTQLAEMLRFQREQRAEELAQKAAVKILFPTMLFIFPPLFVILAGPAALQIKKCFTSSNYQHAAAKQKH